MRVLPFLQNTYKVVSNFHHLGDLTGESNSVVFDPKLGALTTRPRINYIGYPFGKLSLIILFSLFLNVHQG